MRRGKTRTLDGMTAAAQALEQYFNDLTSRGENLDRPLLWSFFLRDVAAGDISRLKAELQKKGYRVDVSTTLTESFPSKVDARKQQRHTLESLIEAWKQFESIADRYSCSFTGVGYEP